MTFSLDRARKFIGIDSDGFICVNQQAIVGRVLMRGTSDLGGGNVSSMSGGSSSAGAAQNAGDLSIAQALGLARDQLFKSLGASRATTDGF